MHDPLKTGARCLDGTPSGLYYSKGYDTGANKTIIHFLGGGWCYGLEPAAVADNCFYRSQTNYGSTSPNVTNSWGDILTYGDWYFPGDYKDDINFYNWNRFIFIYCDGTGH